MKVSVIVAAYNAQDMIEETVKSLLKQTLDELEVIVVNDASKDNTKEILDRMKLQYSNLRVLHHTTNLGIGKTRNDGIALATGEYIGFCDADDYITNTMFEEYYDLAIEEQCDIVTGHYYKVFENMEPVLFHVDTFAPTNYKENPKLSFLVNYAAWNKIFKRDLLIKYNIRFDEKLKYEDTPFVFKAIYHANKIVHIDQGFYHYRIMEGSETTTYDQRVFDMFEIMKEINCYDNQMMSEELMYFNIQQLTRYMLQQRYQTSKESRNKFINKAYERLDSLGAWRKNPYYLDEPLSKRIIKSHPRLMRIYCGIYSKIKG